MAEWEEIERFRDLVVELELPRHDFALFGVKCPYCGKTDRIHKLEEPPELPEAPTEYERIWNKFRSKGDLVVCKFCRQILRLSESKGSASPLTEL
ncbi:MAG: hypothetical protein JSV50_15340 [Desulfobacteraceae bacterium]|nr:MAG: hypothetical protein JSV50_15340 [Desulfobacteraceae bacterium]